MKTPTHNEITNTLVSAAIPCIENFYKLHENETFFGFALEILAEEGYFHLASSSIESFEPTISSYIESGESLDVIMDEVKWNNQEWQYFNFNYNCTIWTKLWRPMELVINSYKEYINSLPEERSNQYQNDFFKLFEKSARDAFEQIKTNNIFNKINKTSDFQFIVFEHNEVF